MDWKSLVTLIAIATHVISLGYFAHKFFQLNNIILGAEWVILAGSGLNVLVWAFTQTSWQWELIWLADTFSRAFGMTLFVILGMRTATHNFKPSLGFDLVLFAVTGAISAFLWFDKSMDPYREPIFHVIFVVFLGYLIHYCYRLFALGERKLAWHLVASSVALTIVHLVFKLWKIPGDEAHVQFVDTSVSFFTWAYAYSVIYFVYVAFARHANSRTDYEEQVTA